MGINIKLKDLLIEDGKTCLYTRLLEFRQKDAGSSNV